MFGGLTSEVESLLMNSNSFDEANKQIDSYKFSYHNLTAIGDYLRLRLMESYQFGRISINPKAEPLKFAGESKILDVAFDLEPINMIEFLKNQAFTVAHINSSQLLDRIRDSLTSAMQTGKNYATFKNEIDEVFQATGVTPLKPFHLETVFIQNNQNAYQSGKLREMLTPEMQKEFSYWQYVTMDDQFVRPNHIAMHGYMARSDDSVWGTWYPPNGFRCRCDVEVYAEDELDQAEKRLANLPSGVGPDRGFERLITERVERIKPKVGEKQILNRSIADRNEIKAVERWTEVDGDYSDIRAVLSKTTKKYAEFMARWEGTEYLRALKKRAKLFDEMFNKYSALASANKTLYRGLKGISEDVYNTFKNYKVGKIVKIDRALQSWSYKKHIVNQHFVDESFNSIFFELKSNRKNIKELLIENLSSISGEGEVIIKNTRFRLLSISEQVFSEGGRMLKIKLEEISEALKEFKGLSEEKVSKALADGQDWKEMTLEKRKKGR